MELLQQVGGATKSAAIVRYVSVKQVYLKKLLKLDETTITLQPHNTMQLLAAVTLSNVM
jgi:hypothetical protein